MEPNVALLLAKARGGFLHCHLIKNVGMSTKKKNNNRPTGGVSIRNIERAGFPHDEKDCGNNIVLANIIHHPQLY